MVITKGQRMCQDCGILVCMLSHSHLASLFILFWSFPPFQRVVQAICRFAHASSYFMHIITGPGS